MPPLEERTEYPYQNIRSKNFPWGDGDKVSSRSWKLRYNGRMISMLTLSVDYLVSFNRHIHIHPTRARIMLSDQAYISLPNSPDLGYYVLKNPPR